jgi:methylated-DNA-[protein]-cysteine S-methyltransferase
MNASSVIDSPIGPLYLEASILGLRKLSFSSNPRKYEKAVRAAPREAADARAAAHLAEAVKQVREYFEGSRRAFALELDMAGTPFQKRVWAAISAIPYSRTISYAQLAAAAGAPGAYRAAGAACGANPIALVVPCHRVVGSDGGLHGFGGGLPAKRWLLDHEASTVMAAAARQAVPV